MDASQLSGSPDGFAESLRDAARYWEPRRVVYNIALAVVFVGWLIWAPDFGPFTQESLLALFALALIANACYCAVYAVELTMRHSSQWRMWQGRRWILWLTGTLFALALEYYWIGDEIYPGLH